MFALTYVLMALTGLLVAGGIALAFRDRTRAFMVMGAALVVGLLAGLSSHFALNEKLPPRAYDAVRKAATADGEVDAAAQTALADNVITPAEFAEIAQIYHEKTGKNLADLVDRKDRRKAR